MDLGREKPERERGGSLIDSKANKLTDISFHNNFQIDTHNHMKSDVSKKCGNEQHSLGRLGGGNMELQINFTEIRSKSNSFRL